MRIHSSSLTLTPVKFNQQAVDKQNNASKKNETVYTSDTNDNTSVFSSFSYEESKKISEYTGQAIHTIAEESIIPLPRNNRILKALSAYSQELKQPSLDQRAPAIKGIDTYA
jgi:hypothetical protein